MACLDGNLIELQEGRKNQQNSFEERSTRSGKLESKIFQLSEMLEEFLYCAYLRQASEQRLLAEFAAWQRMCAERSCKPQARATEKLDMDSLPLKDRESQTGMCCYQEWSVLLRYSALGWLLRCAYSIACHHMHAQQIAKLQQLLQEPQFSYEQLESAVRNKDLQVAEFQSITEKEAARPTGLGEVNKRETSLGQAE